MAESSITGFNRLNFLNGLGNVAALNQFYASIELPTALQSVFPETDQFRRKIAFAIKAGNVPDATVGQVDVHFRGSAKARLPGDRDTSGTWDVMVRADVNTVVREVFEKWDDSLVGHVDHDTIDDYDLDITKLFGVGEIHQLSRNGKILKSWMFDGIWPSTIGAISYDWSSENTIVEFPVTLVFQHKESSSTRNNVISTDDLTSGSILF